MHTRGVYHDARPLLYAKVVIVFFAASRPRAAERRSEQQVLLQDMSVGDLL